MIDTSRAKKLLGNGLPPSVVACAIGCSESYISQLLGDETFAQEVAILRTTDILKAKDLDDKYDGLEEKLLKKLEDLLPFFTKPRDVLSALQMVNGAKRKAIPGEANILEGKVVRLTLPNVIINNYKISMHGEMIEVGGRDLRPLASSVLLKTLEDKVTKERRESHESSGEQKQLPREITSQNVPSERIITEDSV